MTPEAINVAIAEWMGESKLVGLNKTAFKFPKIEEVA